MAETAQAKVMVVEDDALLSDLVARKFTSQNFDMVYAPSGEDALEKISHDPIKPQLILLDIRLPGIDGFEVLRQLKANPETAKIPVIVFSNFGEDSDIEKAREMGATRFIVKVSLTLDELVNVVKTTLGETQ